MKYFDTILDILSIPFLNILKSNGRLYWVYLLSALIIGFFAILFQTMRGGKFSVKVFLTETLDFSHWMKKSSLVDFVYFFTESIFYTLFFSYFVITTLTVSIFTFKILFFFRGNYNLKYNFFIQLLFTIFFLLAYDLGRFWIHKKLHTLPILWEFHKFHHSAETLNVFTVYRVHPLESLLLNSAGGILTGIVTGMFVYFFPSITIFSFLGINFGLFIFHLYSNLRHSLVWITFPDWLSHILLSPAQHQIHHSKKEEHMHQNFGAIFSFWDYFSDSLYIPKEKEKLEFGLPKVSNIADYTRLHRIFLVPFKKAYCLFRK